jgi:protein-S-isoprenylcysteine O-methyltransferase Ste14
VWILVGAFVAHLDWQTCMAVLVAFAAISIRIMREEREVALRYPQYVEYRRNTYRIVPWIF